MEGIDQGQDLRSSEKVLEYKTLCEDNWVTAIDISLNKHMLMMLVV